jgi:CHAT domain-containing protein
MGDLDRAAESFSEAESISENHGMITDEQTWLSNIAQVQFLRRDFREAERSYKRSLELARKLDDRQEVIYSLHGLARIAIKQKQFSLAERYNQEAFTVTDVIGNQENRLYGELNQAQIASATGQPAYAVRLFEKVVDGAGDNVGLQADGLDGLAKLEGELRQTKFADKHYRAALSVLDKERASLGREEYQLSYPTNAKDVYNDYIGFLMERDKWKEAFVVAELHRSRTLTDGLGLQRDLTAQSFDTAEMQRAAARLKRVVLSYWLGPERSFLWAFQANGSQVFVLPGEDQLRPLVERYRAHLTGAFQSQDANDTDGQDLYKILIGPVERWIKPEAQVTIIPDGALCGLNFETLPVSFPKPHYWIEDVSITNASSTILLSSGRRSASRRSAQPAKTLLLIGNPKAPEYYQPLAHAGDEMGFVREHFSSKEETVISGADATPSAYFQAKPENYSLIHFVAHGTASRVSPLDSAVVLSADGNSHNLYARDIANVKLHARLVTISACDSAGSRIYSSEGLVGLSWAFLRAGAQQVIAALWEVNDASTPRLMNRFYSGIASGEEPAVALRAAKLELLRSQTVYRRPFYWAPFVLYEASLAGNS